MTRTLVIANQKGGIGKSTSAANLARAFSEKDHRVLLIDLDPQGGLSASFGVNSFEVRRSMYSLLQYPKSSLARILRPVAPYIALAPSSNDLSNLEIMLSGQADGVTRLRDALVRNQMPFDFIIIDTPPTLGVLTVNGLIAAQELIVPVQSNYLAMRGVRSILDTVDRIKTTGMNPQLNILGIVATMFRSESEHAKEAVDEMRTVFGDKMFNTVLMYDDIVPEAPVAGQSMLDYAPEHRVSQAYRQLAEEIMNHD